MVVRWITKKIYCCLQPELSYSANNGVLDSMAAPPVHNSTRGLIGNTPLVQLHNIVPSDHADVYLKLESINPTGSYKDRMALAMIEEAEKRADLKTRHDSH
ncbi:hypothetical protein N7492_008190 [Penicillium capsulatum]|uniref:Tryptophan synthase beta chain-like PALP domain-containing protein n=1 Tax=Penicillium capsulatum TaxID=69766 RepID=A0A9W9HR94_9EURO|nr:hypothetical protein N7492_008190 [Penicillium capsulatum]KAJ6105600.1 hypothetical protein N7512_009117 [Penicillium capsulatum]